MTSDSVIYEVELRADPGIAQEFDAWLGEHVHEMLTLPGFVGAEILHPDDMPDHVQVRVVQYQLASRADLDRYLDEDAPRMRAAGLARFGDRFSASRRIFAATPRQPTSATSRMPAPLGSGAASAQTELCKNCGYPITGSFCSQCGQKAGVHVLSFSEWFADIAEALFTFDSRVFRSVVPLVVRPGFLTREFVAGRRARYIAPLRLYLFISIIFFLLAGNIARIDAGSDMVFDTPVAAQGKSAAKPGAAQDDTDIRLDGLDWLPMHDVLQAKLRAQVRKAKADPRAFMNALIASMLSNVPKMMFFFLPLVALMLKFLYLRSGRYFLEHLVFSLHYHSFFFLALILFMTAGQLGDNYAALSTPVEIFEVVLWAYLPYYLFRAMRVNYGQGRFKTLVKYFLLGFGYFFSLLITFTITTLVSFFTT